MSKYLRVVSYTRQLLSTFAFNIKLRRYMKGNKKTDKVEDPDANTDEKEVLVAGNKTKNSAV
jgi:hypothetical protein